jgi:hypothetical protein
LLSWGIATFGFEATKEAVKASFDLHRGNPKCLDRPAAFS